MQSAPTPAVSKPQSPTRTPTGEVDPVAVGMTAEGIVALCDDHLARAGELVSEVKKLKDGGDDALTKQNVLLSIDRVSLEVSMAAGFAELMGEGHPDEAVRDAAKECRPKASKFFTELMLDEDFAAVVKRYAATKPKLDPTEQRLLDELLRDFRRNGLELEDAGKKRLRELNEELTKLAQDFGSNISDAVGKLKVDPKRLKGLPEGYVSSHPPGEDGKVELTTNYPDYFPVVTYAEDRKLARELHELFDNRAADENVKILERVLVLRREKANLLGYDTWADYAIEPRMAKTADAVDAFLKKAADAVREPAKKEYAAFRAEHVKLGGKWGAPLPIYDRLYLEQRLREKKYGFDAKELSKYFEVEAVTKGMLEIIEKLYGIEFQRDDAAEKWHEDVVVLNVRDGGKRIARIYLDLYPREGKYKHAAMFEVRPAGELASGEYLTPISALVCNFPKPGDSPALLTHQQVQTYFHEFGHALHHALTTQKLASYSGTNTVRDFVEAPSQMFEEWTWKRETLDLFAKHHETGKKIPDELFEAMTKSRSFGRALHTERQISLATLDFEYHRRKPPFDTDEVFDEVMKKTQSFVYIPDTHFQANFGHLMGYDAGYYGYQWALAIARDVLTRFEKEGFLDKSVASDWRSKVLARGAGPDENQLVKDFLGRDPNLEAYSAFLAGK